MFKKLFSHLYTYFLNFTELQLVITLMSLPILICWGIPISGMFLISNVMFTPLLILFLWCSALFAICALTHIPCQFLIKTLTLIAQLWCWLLSFSKPSWLFGFSYQTLLFCIFIIIGIIIWYSIQKPKIIHSIIFLTGCMCFMLCVRHYYQKSCIYKINNLDMIALRIAGKNYIFDYGALCSKQNFYNHIDYTIIPALIKQAGITTIDTLILCKPSNRLAQIAWQFAQQTNTQTILTPEKFSCYKTLKMMNQSHNNQKNICIMLQDTRKKKKQMNVFSSF